MKNLFSDKEWSNPKYIVGLADKETEFDELYKLRYDIFNVELEEGIKENESIKRDIDKFDASCDHLIVKDIETKKIVATYRIHPSWKMHRDGFYTSTEFDISSLKLEKRRAIEVGRACIHNEHRGNLIIAIMWIAIKRYCILNKVDALFGVASTPKCTIEELSSLYQYLLKEGYLINDGTVKPIDNIKADLIKNPPENYRKELMSPLVKGYLKIGAKLIGEPVFDPIFRCYDFFVLLDMMKNVNWDYLDTFSKLLNLEK